jgi:hypothetical protein
MDEIIAKLKQFYKKGIPLSTGNKINTAFC